MAALNKASTIPRFHLVNSRFSWVQAYRNQRKCIKSVVEHVTHFIGIRKTKLLIDYHPVGVEFHMQQVIEQLNINSQSKYPLLLGILGIGGIGKTIIAKAIYNHICCQFEGKSFLQNVGQVWRRKDGQKCLHEQLLSDIYRTTKIQMDTTKLGTMTREEKLRKKRIFIVLQDVDHVTQVRSLCGNCDWFGPGSKIIITTRKMDILALFGVHHIYSVKRMDQDKSLELFSWQAFEQASPNKKFVKLSEELVACCDGVPLALKVLGAFLSGRVISDWENLLQKLKRKACLSLEEILQTSLDYLNDEEKTILHNIACFFVGMDRDDAIDGLNISRHVAEHVISVLQDKALVTIDENGKLEMHDELRHVIRSMNLKSYMKVEPKKYDVFLSFRGEDTRASFTSHLYAFLQNAGIYAFMDDDEIQRGEHISTSLSQAIKGSRISVIILSRNYANSRWCMQELENIMECRRTLGLVVVPVFYGVDPSEVRHQTGEFGEAFKDLIRGISIDEDHVKSWKIALLELSGIVGFVIINTRKESEDIKNIVEHVTCLLDKADLFVANHPVGVESRVQDVIRLLNNEQSNNVLLLGIWGMGGIGKTTIAKAIYNRIRHNFEAKSFVLNVREIWEQNNGQVSLQQRLLSDTYKTTKIKIDNVESGKMILKERLRQRRIFLVLDDVNKLDQLNALCGSHEWFGQGSRIIITTRDEDLLCKLDVDHVYRMKEMNKSESLKLFSLYAFKQASPSIGFTDLSREVVEYSGGLPLALEVIGSFLLTKGIREWKSVLEKLKMIPNDEVLRKLRISFDGLGDDKVKELFLDIAFFFIGMDRDDVIRILDDCGLFPVIGVSILVQQSLITVDKKNKLGMHDLLRDMGREIVCEKSPEVAEMRSRLWLYEDVLDVLSKNIKKANVKGLTLKLPTKKSPTYLETNAFKKMNKLRLLQLAGVQLDGDYQYFSSDLRWLCWHEFPLEHIPTNFQQGSLVSIELKYSNLEQVWKKSQMLKKLKILNLSHSRNLRQTPNFTTLPNLEKLILKDCPSLSSISHTIGHLNEILFINLKDCTGLCELPRSIYKLKSLKTLILSGCINIEKLEEDLEQMESLTTLIVDKTSITKVPLAIVRSKNIGYVSLCGYEEFSRDVFPSIIRSWMSPTNNILSRVQSFKGMSSLALLDEHYSSFPGLSSILKDLQELDRIWVKCDSEVQLNQIVERILDSLNITNCEEFEATPSTSQVTNAITSTFIDYCSHVHNPSSKSSFMSLSIQMGMNCCVTDTLRESILQRMPPIGPGVLPGDNYPNWLTFNSEGSSVSFEIPEVNGRSLKTIMCIVFYSSPNNITSEGLKTMLVINYTKTTIQLYKRDVLTSFDNEEWQRIISNIEPGNKVKIVVIFGDRFIVKKTTIYLIYDEPIDERIEHHEGDNNFVISYDSENLVGMSLEQVDVKKLKAEWSDTNLEAFLKLCDHEMRARNKPCTHFTKIEWENVREKFNETANLTYGYKQFKSMWHNLQKEWALWKKLLVGRDSDLRWDATRRTVIASNNEWFPTKIQENPELAKFTEQGPKYLPEMEILFEGIAATGFSINALPECSRGFEGFGIGAEGTHVNEINEEDTDDDQERPHETGMKVTSNPISSRKIRKRKWDKVRKKRGGSVAKLSTKLDQIIDVLKSISNGIESSTNLDQVIDVPESSSNGDGSTNDATSINACVNKLKNLPGLELGSELFFMGVRLVNKRANRLTFVALEDPALQLGWIKSHTWADVH